jgi:hypothetical protein
LSTTDRASAFTAFTALKSKNYSKIEYLVYCKGPFTPEVLAGGAFRSHGQKHHTWGDEKAFEHLLYFLQKQNNLRAIAALTAHLAQESRARREELATRANGKTCPHLAAEVAGWREQLAEDIAKGRREPSTASVPPAPTARDPAQDHHKDQQNYHSFHPKNRRLLVMARDGELCRYQHAGSLCT